MPRMNTPAAPNSSPTDEQLDAYWAARCDLLYKAWVQVRYHRRRQRFFDLVDKGTKATTLLLGASLFGKHLDALPIIATAISALGALALVFGYGDKKQQHKELAEQAAALVASIESTPSGRLTAEETAKWAAEFARFCAKAPPPLKSLTIMCEHEQSVLDGHPDHIKLPRLWRQWLSQVKG